MIKGARAIICAGALWLYEKYLLVLFVVGLVAVLCRSFLTAVFFSGDFGAFSAVLCGGLRTLVGLCFAFRRSFVFFGLGSYLVAVLCAVSLAALPVFNEAEFADIVLALSGVNVALGMLARVGAASVLEQIPYEQGEQGEEQCNRKYYRGCKQSYVGVVRCGGLFIVPVSSSVSPLDTVTFVAE